MSDNGDKVKVLVCGDVNGNFQILLKKLNSLQKSKAGPFDLCLCVGPFFGSSPIEASSEAADGGDNNNNTDTKDSKLNEAQDFLVVKTKKNAKETITCPIPLYFYDLGQVPQGLIIPCLSRTEKTAQDDAEISLDDDGEEEEEKSTKSEPNVDTNDEKLTKICENVFYMNKASADILSLPHTKTSENTLIVGYVSPNTIFSSQPSNSSVTSLENIARNSSFVGCDILLTSDWGQGLVSSNAITRSGTSVRTESGSYDIAEFATLCKPRYHFASSSSHQNQYVQSLPYQNMSTSSSPLHSCRFISLGNVISVAESKNYAGKTRKFIHALGVRSIVSMGQLELVSQEQNMDIEDHPYTDATYQQTSSTGESITQNQGLNNNSNNNSSFSQAQARRIMMEERNHSMNHHWNTNNNRKRSHHDEVNIKDNKCLFVHGLQKSIPPINGLVLLDTFSKFIKTRCPPNKNFGFIEFETHEQALNTLNTFKMPSNDSHGLLVQGVHLILRWSTSGTSSSQSENNNNSSNHQSGLPSHNKRQRLTEPEVSDSCTLYLKLNSSSPDTDSDLIKETHEYIRALSQKSLEDAINDMGENENEESSEKRTRITAEEDPALKVSIHFPEDNQHAGKSFYSFLKFASHAAAAMAIASLTGHPDGGVISQEHYMSSQQYSTVTSMLLNDQNSFCSLYWAKGASEKTKKIKVRHECWFCLASSTCETHLIVSILEHCYITMAKGPLDDFHVLIVPNNHDHDDEDQDKQQKLWEEVLSVKMKIRNFFKTILKKELFVFEHALPQLDHSSNGKSDDSQEQKSATKTKRPRMYHTHLQCIPVSKQICTSLQGNLENCAEKYNIRLKELAHSDEVNVPWNRGNSSNEKSSTFHQTGYFYAEVPFLQEGSEALSNCKVKKFLYQYQDPEAVAKKESSENEEEEEEEKNDSEKQNDNRKRSLPVGFGREVYATSTGNPKHSDWKLCVETKEKETESAQEFRNLYSKFDIS
eukprot:CAMPEP_0178958724 /NCGR_PEP_ID=MMETSP0789-20121207/11816_1 /TAXON_ID=3005 /ORGANISM="Rhizosolenia setigera, Strain CCMP 1694" /LENGTH=986 /DNA_ID=CAMNT_0020641491 /DNA_START=24 /DNA_END=2984 /DNA_ORIENTATION=+